jgi:hydrogenase expression/formation protein HypE
MRAVLPIGKLPEEFLRKHVLPYLGYRRGDVVLWPGFGEDAGAVKMSKKTYIFSTDPITGSKGLVGWLAVQASANDVAVCGGEPRWFSSTILMPRGSRPNDIHRVVKQIHTACRELKVAIVTGHTEVAPFVSEPVVVGHMVGVLVADRVVTSAGAKPGDHIVVVKSPGLEGSAILATDFPEQLISRGVDKREVALARGFVRYISVVKEALAYAKIGASALHDPTEGGLLGGLYEIAKASGVGFEVYREKIPINPIVSKICSRLDLDPLKLISSGSLIVVAKNINPKLLKRTGGRVVGKILSRKKGMNVYSENGRERVKGPVHDELWRFLEEYAS